MLIAYHPETPVFAVTQDIYVHRRCTHLLEKVGLTERTSACDAGRSRIVVRSSDDCFTADPDIDEVSGVEFHFHSAAGKEPRLFARFRMRRDKVPIRPQADFFATRWEVFAAR